MHLHGIMTDSAIRARCELPIAHVRFGVKCGFSMIEERAAIYYPSDRPNYASLEEYVKQEAERIIDRRGGQKGGYILEVNTDTDEPPVHSKPMIHPFVPHQVRDSVRVGSPLEHRYFEALGFDDAKKLIGGHISKMHDDPSAGLLIHEKIISYGLSSMGYDVRLGKKFKIFTNAMNATIDPLNMSDDNYVDFEGDICIIPPNSYILGHTEEELNLEPDEIAICLGKSTYARAGAIVNVTPIEPGFKGQVVIEISNATPNPLKVYAGQGIAQFMFFKSAKRCEVSYADRGGKYQNQQGVTTARV